VTHDQATQHPGILLKGIHLSRGSTPVFSDLNLRLSEHRIGLIGDNGAGKTSLFRLLCGLETPQQGQLTLPPARTGQPVVGMMFQNSDEQIIFPTVEEELALGLHHLQLPRRALLAHVRSWLAQQGLADWGLLAVSALSQGQRQRVCWWSLLIAAPQVLLLDEPFASLDLPSQARFKQDMAQATQQIILSTHQLEQVRGFERVIWLDQGRVRGDGPGSEVCAAYEGAVVEGLRA
jgi:biotin transport system ATP-binding protein